MEFTKKAYYLCAGIIVLYVIYTCLSPIMDEKTIVEKSMKIEDITPIRTILGNADLYIGKDVIIGPLTATDNYLKEKYLQTYRLKKDGLDWDASICVYYDETPNEQQWINFDCSKYPMIFVYGTVRKYSDTDEIYIDAIEINESYKEQWAEHLKHNQ